MNDPIVEEVRKYRNDHAKRFNYDLDAICNDLINSQCLHKKRLVNFKKKKCQPVASCNQPSAAATG